MKIIRCITLLFAVILTFSASAKKVELPDAMLAGKNFYFERVTLHQNLPYDNIHLSLAKTVTNNDVVLFYFFNVNNSGFIIVSADDAVTPIIGYSFSGSFVAENQPENFTGWMEHYKQ